MFRYTTLTLTLPRPEDQHEDSPRRNPRLTLRLSTFAVDIRTGEA
jgi:hypothetical protein